MESPKSVAQNSKKAVRIEGVKGKVTTVVVRGVEAMDDVSFKARVEKVFGSLASSSSSSSSLWSITDDEVERREWRRSADTSARDEIPCSSAFDEFLKKDGGISRSRNFDEDDRDGIDGLDGGELNGQEEWSIRSSIGMDRTLDYEVKKFYFLSYRF